jgi:UDP-glucose 4-epimerase
MSSNKKKVLVTGGAGFIGSHTLIELILSGFSCVVLDNLDNSSEVAIQRVKEILHNNTTNKELAFADHDINLQVCDLVDLDQTRKVLKQTGPFEACIHFAGLKAVGESVEKPLHYYYNNFVGTLNLVAALEDIECYNFVFSSSATVYGSSVNVPLKEDEPLGGITNPYGRTKLMIEDCFRDLGTMPNSKWKVVLLRYFNPVGAHPSGRIGEDPVGVPTNLLPFVAQVAVGRRAQVNVFGSDYPTPDGTGVRDYIHVCDLAQAHVAAVKKVCNDQQFKGVVPYNIGTGRGSSVLEVIAAFKKASGKEIPFVLAPRRAGDVATSYCDPSKAERELGFRAQLTLEDACRDAWHWQSHNPNGFALTAAAGGSVSRKGLVFTLL